MTSRFTPLKRTLHEVTDFRLLCVVLQAGGGKVADVDSSILEQKFLDNDKDVVEFTAGSQSYSLSFQGKQTV